MKATARRDQDVQAYGDDPSHGRINLLEAIVVFCIAAAIIIFVFAMSAAGLGNYQFRLPEFLTDSVKTAWSLATAGSLAIAGSALDLALRRHPRKIDYVRYILGTTALLFVPIVALMLFGRFAQDAWRAPAIATAAIDLSPRTIAKRSFTLTNLVSVSPVGLYVSGEVTLQDGHLKGTASARITRPSGAAGSIPQNFTISQLALHVCYYTHQQGSPIVSSAVAPRFPQPSNTTLVDVRLPLTSDAIDVKPFQFDIEVPDMEHPEAAWLCAFLSDRNNAAIVSLV